MSYGIGMLKTCEKNRYKPIGTNIETEAKATYFLTPKITCPTTKNIIEEKMNPIAENK